MTFVLSKFCVSGIFRNIDPKTKENSCWSLMADGQFVKWDGGRPFALLGMDRAQQNSPASPNLPLEHSWFKEGPFWNAGFPD